MPVVSRFGNAGSFFAYRTELDIMRDAIIVKRYAKMANGLK